MANISIEVKKNISKALEDSSEFRSRLEKVMQVLAFIPEAQYVQEAPTLEGDFRRGIKVEKGLTPLTYIVKSTARSKGKGFDYPLALYMGTGRLKGAADFGYTVGRVRTNDVARRIGGIRPNKAAMRARDKSEPKVVEEANVKMKLLFN